MNEWTNADAMLAVGGALAQEERAAYEAAGLAPDMGWGFGQEAALEGVLGRKASQWEIDWARVGYELA